MNGKEQIINNIIAGAEAAAKGLHEEAQLKAEEILEAARVQAQKSLSSVEVQVATAGEDLLKRHLLTAELEVKKFRLELKRDLMARCFDRAFQHMANLPKQEYLKFVSTLLKNAEKGETVRICKKDKDIITQAFLDENAKGKQLTLDKTFGDFSGGIVLVKDNYEKRLTLEALFEDLRQDTEAEISGILFKD